MPKASKPRATESRRDPLKTSDSNAPKTTPSASKTPSSAKKPSEKKKPAAKASASSTSTSSKKPKATAPPESYLLLVRLSGTNDPVITRLLSVPSHWNFAQFSEVLRIAFGWAGGHGHSFSVTKFVEEGKPVNFFTGSGEEVLSLHPDTDMREFDPNPERIQAEADFTLKDIYDGEKYKEKVEIAWEYDHGDSWLHEVAFLGRADPSLRKGMNIPDELQVICLGGEGHPAAEDSGGVIGFEGLKELFTKPRSKDADGLKDWYKNECSNGDPKGLDPYKWSVFDVNDGFYYNKW